MGHVLTSEKYYTRHYILATKNNHLLNVLRVAVVASFESAAHVARLGLRSKSLQLLHPGLALENGRG